MVAMSRALLFAILLSLGHAESLFGKEDRSDWIDPTDMLNYDTSTKQMKKPVVEPPSLPLSSVSVGSSLHKLYEQMAQKLPEEKDLFVETVRNYVSQFACEKKPDSEKSDVSAKLSQCQANLRELREELEYVKKERQPSKPSLEKTYFRQYVRKLLQHFSRSVPDGLSLLYNTEIMLNSDDLELLERFANTDRGNVQDAHDVLTRMIQHVELVDAGDLDNLSTKSGERFKEYLTVILQIVAVVTMASAAVAIQVRLKLSWIQLSVKLLILLFVISIPWNWWHMYKVAVAKRHAEAIKDIPLECRPEKQTASQSFWTAIQNAFLLNTDKCAQYYEQMLVDPAYEVAPTQALAVTITKFLLEPLEHIGHGVSKLISGTLQHLPVHLWPFALGFLCLMSFLVLILVFGSRIKLFHLFTIEPGKTSHPPVRDDERHRQLQDRIQDLTLKLEKLSLTPPHEGVELKPSQQAHQFPAVLNDQKPSGTQVGTLVTLTPQVDTQIISPTARSTETAEGNRDIAKDGPMKTNTEHQSVTQYDPPNDLVSQDDASQKRAEKAKCATTALEASGDATVENLHYTSSKSDS